jgi:hypothetical protein
MSPEPGEDKVGKLTVGYAGTKFHPKIGPEFTFGIYMHEALQEPILLIKPAWGGKSLNYHFRPPSAGEWTPPPGHPDLTVGEDEPEPLPVPKSLDLPVGYQPGKEYLNPYAGRPGFFLLQGLRGCEVGELNGVYPIYICQDIKLEAKDFPLKTGDLILGLNGQGMPENPKDFWREMVYVKTMHKLDWTLKLDRWRDGKIEEITIDLAEFTLPGGKADIPELLKEKERKAAERKKNQGSHYRMMMDYINNVLGDIKRVYPEYDPEQGYEIAGFVWFQGWNDLVDSGVYPSIGKPRRFEQYSWLMNHFIRDVRKDLNAPDMPFVIGVLGVGGRLLSFALVLTASAAADPTTTLWYDEPAVSWQHEALPIGNGRIGAMIFGKVERERIALNEETVWSGARVEWNRPDASKNLPKIRELLLAGKNDEAEALVNQILHLPRRRLARRCPRPVGLLSGTRQPQPRMGTGINPIPLSTSGNTPLETINLPGRRQRHQVITKNRGSRQPEADDTAWPEYVIAGGKAVKGAFTLSKHACHRDAPSPQAQRRTTLRTRRAAHRQPAPGARSTSTAGSGELPGMAKAAGQTRHLRGATSAAAQSRRQRDRHPLHAIPPERPGPARCLPASRLSRHQLPPRPRCGHRRLHRHLHPRTASPTPRGLRQRARPGDGLPFHRRQTGRDLVHRHARPLRRFETTADGAPADC